VRYKDSIEDLEDLYADNVLGLRPVWYRSKCAADNPTWSWYGLIAEEVAVIEPRLICWGYADEDYEHVEREVDGKFVCEHVPKEGARMIPDGVAYDRLAVLLLNIVKRHENRIERLEEKILAERDQGGLVKT
jgi:hypothetical protein